MDSFFTDGLSFALPLLIIAIGGIYSERSGITNLALEGLLGVGAFTGALFIVFFGKYFAVGSSIPMYIAFFCAALGGAVFAMLHALLCVNFKADQVISGVVINILSLALTVFLAQQINRIAFDLSSDKFEIGTSIRFDIPIISQIPWIGALFKRVYPFEIIIVALVVLMWYIMNKTRFGMRLRACGDNPHAVDGAGVSVAKNRFAAVMISGALAGIGGLCFAYSISTRFSSAVYFGAGYLSIAALIFGNWRILPTLGACLLFGFAKSGGQRLILALEMNAYVSDLLNIIPYVLTLIMLLAFSKTNRAPRALGEIYDKSKR